MKMYKIITFLTAAACFVLTGSALATSGACSWHGGVNCSAGRDWDGSAICNDGWRDSTVLFSQVIECQDSQFKPLCTPSESAQLDIKYGVPDLQRQYDDINAQAKVMTDEYNALPSAIIGSEAQAKSLKGAELMVILAKENGIQSQLKLALDQSLAECRALGSTSYQKKLQQALQEIDIIKQQSALDQQNAILKQLQAQCPNNTTLKSDNKCYCNTGYVESNLNKDCVTYTNYCAELNATYNAVTKQCDCSPGYDLQNRKCVQVTDEYCLAKNDGIGAFSKDGACYCAEGYALDVEKNRCFKKIGKVVMEKFVVPRSNVNVRAKAIGNSKIVGVAKKNNKYEILDDTNKLWIRIKLSGTISGWVLRTLVITK